jgi:hypothetical protein
MTPTRDDLRDGCRRDGAPLRAKLTYHCPEHFTHPLRAEHPPDA